MEKAKKPKVEEQEDEEARLVLAIEKLQEVQEELEKVNEEASDKVLEVEQRYNEVRRPVYKKRNDIISTIEDFWLTAFLSHPVLGDLLTPDDQKVFKYLHSLEVEDFKDVKSGYSVAFNFRPNPYFVEEKLTKIFRFTEDGSVNVTGTVPTWKPGMDLMENGQAVKGGNKRPLQPSSPSFFSWFMELGQKEGLDDVDNVAEVIKDDLWPNPLKYFNQDLEDEFDDSDASGDNDDDGSEDGGEDEEAEEDEQEG